MFDPGTGPWTITQIGGSHTITNPGSTDMTHPSSGENTGSGASSQSTATFDLSANDVTELKNLVRGLPSGNLDDDAAHATGIRDLEGTGNNVVNPDFGAADQPFIRLTDAHYGEFDSAINNFLVNPIHDGLDSREISNILGAQESGLEKNSEDANIFFMAFGQYLDHGLDFLPKGGNGTLSIGTDPNDDPADLTRGSVFDIVGGVPEHLNQASPFADQNQAYGSTELVGQFLRESVRLNSTDANGVPGARLLAGADDPSNADFKLLPTLRELIQHHWGNDTIFTDASLPGGQMSFRSYFTDLPFEDPDQPGVPMMGTLVDSNGAINEAMIPALNGSFMESGYTLVGDANPFINLLDHFVAGDLRANENYTLTAMHTVWARNHNFHVEGLADAGFDGTVEELFQAAKILNEVEYQRVVFDEFADVLLGGLKGSGEHGFDDYNPSVDARVSHEFAAAAYRFGHSLIGQTITIIDPNGQKIDVPLVDAFLNPTNDNDAFTAPLPPGYVPQPGYEQIGINPILSGIAIQPAEEVDFNLVDAIRNDLVRIRADLFAFNVARGWDVGLGTMNQVRADLLNSSDPYVQEAIALSGENFTPYSSWEDFRIRNGLSNTVIAQFIAAYPDLELQSQAEIDAFATANPGIDLTGPGQNIVKGIDRVDLWVGGLAEEHINGGMVGSTFWVILHEQFDRLQEGDRFYYLDRSEDFDFYDQIENQSFADIVARNTGLTGLPDEIFQVDVSELNDDDDNQDETQDNDDSNDNNDSTQDNDDNDSQGGSSDLVENHAPMYLTGTEFADVLVGNTGGDTLVGLGSTDTLIAGTGDDTVSGGEGADQLIGGAGNDILLGDGGDDMILAGGGDDFVFGGQGRDHIVGGDGNDTIHAGGDRDFVDAGAGNDTVFAAFNDGDDVLIAGDGIDTYNLSAITSDVTVDFGTSGFGQSQSSQSGTDTINGFENVTTGAGNDTIIANEAVNVMAGGIGNDTFVFNSIDAADGDHITDFHLGDQIDLLGIAANYSFGGSGQFELLAEGATFTQAGQIIVRAEADGLVIEGNVDGSTDIDFTIKVTGKSELNSTDFA